MSRGNRRRLLVGLLVAAALSSFSLGGCSGSGHSGPPTLRSIAITPANSTIGVGSNQQLAAQGTYSDGTTTDISSSVSWSSSDTTMASISGSGLAAAIAIGRPQITATSGGITGSTRLIVVEGTLAPFPRFAYSINLPDYPGSNAPGWSISIYTVDATSGQLRANGYVLLPEAANGIATEPAGKFAYVVNPVESVSAFAIDPAGGGLTHIQDVASGAGGLASFIAVDPSGSFVYATHEEGSLNDGNVWGYKIDRASGELTPISGMPVAAGVFPEGITIQPSGRFAYVANASGGTSVYAIDVASGALSEVPGSPVNGGGLAGSIVIEPSGKFAIVPLGASWSICAIDATTGLFNVATGIPLAAGFVPGPLAVSPSGQYAYVSDNAGNNVWGFAINSTTGNLSPLPTGPFMGTGSTPNEMVVDPSGKVLYILNDDIYSSETIVTFAIDVATGNLGKQKRVRMKGYGQAIALSGGTGPVTYTTKYAYVANNSGNTISAYSINSATGGLTNVSGSPFAAGSGPTVVVDPLGEFLYAVDSGEGAISAFAIDHTTGVLSVVPGSPFGNSGYPGGGGWLVLPLSMAIDSSGQFGYVTNSSPTSNTVTALTIDRATGALGAFYELTAGTAPGVARSDPTGKFVYVTNTLSNNVSGFVIDVAPVAGAPFAAGTDPLGLAIDPSGQYVYVANQGSNSVSAFRIDSQTGALSEIAGSPYTTTAPLALAIDGTGSFLYVANHNATNNIGAYSINPLSGALTSLASSPFTAGNGPNDVTVDFSGKYLYVANGLSNDVSVFSINALNGQLTQVFGSPFAAGSVPGSVVTTGQIQ